MSDPVTSESPLVRFDLAARSAQGRAGDGVTVRERALLGHFNLRGDSRDPRFAAGVTGVLGGAPPIAPNTVSEAQADTMFWLGPDEWLIVTTGERRATLERELRSALTGVRAAITDVSGGQTVVVVGGRHARDVLAKGCPLDLHPRAFGDGQCAQTHLAKAPILIRPVDHATSFEIVVRRSFADYFWVWLEDAAAEFGMESSK
ncbi:MAG: sarcosine oxidase subunit gamma family protein [Betaproteobacteria bacterium]